MPGLADSRWAPPPSIRQASSSWPRRRPETPQPFTAAVLPPKPPPSHFPSPPQSGRPATPEQELSKFLKIVARLNWKLPFLETGYNTATDRLGKPRQQIEANEIHFKLDFYEFYMLIERALVHLMGVYGIVIHAQHHHGSRSESSSETYSNGNGIDLSLTNGNKSKAGRQPERIAAHRYHANVLLALDEPANPLYEAFGSNPEVREQLRRAKDLRNRWKNGDDPELRHLSYSTAAKFIPAPLEAYNLEQILQTIFAAFDRAYAQAEKYVYEMIMGGASGNERIGNGDGGSPINSVDWRTDTLADWEWMVDAMDWEAV